MNSRSLFIGLALAVAVVTAGLIASQLPQNSNVGGYRYQNPDNRGWLGVKKDPKERRGFLGNLFGIPQDVGEGTVGALTGGRSREDEQRRFQEEQMRQQQEIQQRMQRQGRFAPGNQ